MGMYIRQSNTVTPRDRVENQIRENFQSTSIAMTYFATNASVYRIQGVDPAICLK